MEVYWRQVKFGQTLILSIDDGQEEDLGGFRDTKRGIDALAKTFGYDPERAQKGFPTIEDAKAFVESFRPWELYDVQGVTVDPEVRPALDSVSAATTSTPDQPSESADSIAPELQPRKKPWEFWKGS